jgi:hypothetical protein
MKAVIARTDNNIKGSDYNTADQSNADQGNERIKRVVNDNGAGDRHSNNKASSDPEWNLESRTMD